MEINRLSDDLDAAKAIFSLRYIPTPGNRHPFESSLVFLYEFGKSAPKTKVCKMNPVIDGFWEKKLGCKRTSSEPLNVLDRTDLLQHRMTSELAIPRPFFLLDFSEVNQSRLILVKAAKDTGRFTGAVRI